MNCLYKKSLLKYFKKITKVASSFCGVMDNYLTNEEIGKPNDLKFRQDLKSFIQMIEVK